MELPKEIEDKLLNIGTQIFKRDPVILVHYCNDESDWFFIEYNDDTKQLYGYYRFGTNPVRDEGWGYTTMEDIEGAGAYLDTKWVDTGFKETIKKFNLNPD